MHKDTHPDDDEEKIARVMKKIKNRLLVFSGKGGVGKSTIAVNLALALSRKGLRVGLLDVDIHGPNLAKMMGVENKRLNVIDERLQPLEVINGIKLVSLALLLEQDDVAVVWRGPMKMKMIKQFLGDVEWGELDWLICDSPPGTGDEPLSVVQLIPATSAVIVTTPQDVALLDSRKAISFARLLHVNVLGIIENMSGLVCPHCGQSIPLFKTGGGERVCQQYDIPFLGQVPIEMAIVEAGDSGLPFMTQKQDSPAKQAMANIVEKIIARPA